MKNKLIGIILITILSLPAPIRAVDGALPAEQPAFEEIAERANNALDQMDEDIVQPEAVQRTIAIPHKEPISKRKLIKMFLKAMIAVCISCVALYAGLSLYNKIRDKISGDAAKQCKNSVSKTSLSSPTDFEEAIKLFLEKTKWD